jgi:hypothetical protein
VLQSGKCCCDLWIRKQRQKPPPPSALAPETAPDPSHPTMRLEGVRSLEPAASTDGGGKRRLKMSIINDDMRVKWVSDEG